MSETFLRDAGFMCPACDKAELKARMETVKSTDRRPTPKLRIVEFVCPSCKMTFNNLDMEKQDHVL